MNILEKEIEQIVWNYLSDPKILRERDLYIGNKQHYFQQLNLGDYGIADIVGISFDHKNWEIEIEVIELKREVIDNNTLMQAVRYTRALQIVFEKIESGYSVNTDIILIGKTLQTKGDFCFTPDVFDNVTLYTYSIDLIKGLRFNINSAYSITDASLGTGFGVINEIFEKTKEAKQLPQSIEDVQVVDEDVSDDLPF